MVVNTRQTGETNICNTSYCSDQTEPHAHFSTGHYWTFIISLLQSCETMATHCQVVFLLCHSWCWL